ncbi:MAG TPA: NUDIX hydrolase [Ktedonobacterales bacterium]|nr:NUDIX hydrolase [Ktedonobacterales bacterium]
MDWTDLPLETNMASEVKELAGRFGAPMAQIAPGCDDFLRTVDMRKRPGEVCMVVRRPNGLLVTSTKSFYPAGTYRLLTGGIQPGEAIHAALLRETVEETSLPVAVRRFLGIVRYTAADAPPDSPGHGSLQHDGLYVFTTYAFLLDDLGGELRIADESEHVIGFREVSVDDLPAIADHLATLGDDPSGRAAVSDELAATWHAWGVFRAVTHRLVYQALAE